MTLHQGRIGWPMIAGLGVAIVVAGQFSGWNYGLANGWADMFAATILTALLYIGLVLCITELAAAMPSAGGLATYAQAGFGPLAGYFIGLALCISLTVGTGALANFISAYTEAVFGFGGWGFKFALFAVVLGIHLWGVGEAMGLILLSGAVAVAALLLFSAAMIPKAHISALFGVAGSISPDIKGVIASIPFALWLFLGVEQAASASEEAIDPGRTMPRGLLAAIAVLLCTGVGVLIFGPAAGGVAHVAAAGDPLYAAMTSPSAYGHANWLATIVGLGAIFGLIATFFSLSYSASRQFFAMAREGHLPLALGATNRRGAPWAALLLIGVVGILFSAFRPDKLLVAVVLLMSMGYVFSLAAFIRLRLRNPDLPRPFRAPGGIVTASVSLLLSLLVIAACFQLDWVILSGLGTMFVAGCIGYMISPAQIRARRARAT